nr:tyrosine-type recombinase/integrase [Trichocoleus sp. FACHB-262]
MTPPRKPKNQEVRSREHLTPDEVELLMQAAKQEGRHDHRDATLILLMYRHGLRVSEAIALRWDQVDLKQGTLHVNRMKQGHHQHIHYGDQNYEHYGSYNESIQARRICFGRSAKAQSAIAQPTTSWLEPEN